MSITDELREYVRHYSVAGSRKDETLTAIADRIDAAHEAACAEAYGNGVMSVPIALDENAWVKLPVDADGVPIRIGDKVDSDHHEDGTVTGIQFYEMANGGVRTLVAVRPDGWDVPTWRDPEEYAHHHEPTVEDVLLEFHDRMEELGTTDQCIGTDRAEAVDALLRERAELVAEFAAKLRLAEGEDK